MVLFGSIFNTSDRPPEINVENLDLDIGNRPTQLSDAFILALNSTSALKVTLVESKSANGAEESSTLLSIPYGFQSSARTGTAKLLFRYDKSKASSQTAYSIVAGVANEFNIQLLGGERRITIVAESFTSNILRYVDFFIPGVVGMTIMTTGMFGSIGVNTKYRQNKVLRKLATTPLSKLDWVMGMVTYQMLLSILSTIILLGTGYAIFGVKATLSPLFVPLIISGALVFPGMGMIVTRFVKDEEAAHAAGNVVTFPMMFLSGTFFPIETMPSFLQPLAKVLPLTYLNNGLRESMLLSDYTAALTNTLVILPVGLASIIIGAYLMTWREE